MCCACGGGEWVPVVPVDQPVCANSNGDFLDTTGDDCGWYERYPETCGGFNTEDFDSNSMCCVCGGGEMECNDLSDTVDKAGDGCSWYAEHRVACGNYDDDDFNAKEMCCSCGGG